MAQNGQDISKDVFIMYRRKPQGWLKHIDFMLLDIASLILSFVLACITRHGFSAVSLLPHYMGYFTFYLLLVVFLHVVNNTFSGVLRRGYYREFSHTVKHVALAEMVSIVYLFSLQQGEETSRLIIYLVAVYYILLSYTIRILWKRVVQKKGYLFKQAALYIITTKDLAASTVLSLNSEARGEYRIQGMCILDESCIGDVIEGVSVTADMDTVLDFLCDKWVDEVYISQPEQSPYPDYLIDRLTEMGIVVHIKLDPAGTEVWQIRQVQHIGHQLVQTISMTSISTRHALAKRILDIIGGIVGCVITAVLTLILGPMIYFQSPGPIFFTQTRVGKNGKHFKMYKFRSMYLDAEARKAELMKDNRFGNGLMFKMEADPRIIGCRILPDGTVKKGLGNFIRDFSLDEFPQFYNVLKGDLSLVGTRPPTVDEWEKYLYHHRARLSIKPGITGLWQVSGRSKITDFEEVVELDKKYIREWSFGMDLRILLKTVFVILRRDGAM